MRSKAAKALLEIVRTEWDDRAKFLGCRDYTQFRPTWAKGEMTMPEFTDYLQRTMNALHRTCAGNGAAHEKVRLVTGRTKTGHGTQWDINVGDSWYDVLYAYSWKWAHGTYSSRDGRFEITWMRLFKHATKVFFARHLYLSPTKPPPPPPPSKDEVRERKIAALEQRRAKWATKHDRAQTWLIKIDRSLRALRRHVKETA